MIIKRTEIPQEEMSEGVDFTIHHNYAGTAEFESAMSVEIVTDPSTYDFIDNLATLRAENGESQLDMGDFDWKKDRKLVQVIKVLVYQGFLVVDEV